jgi:hypothetical protein
MPSRLSLARTFRRLAASLYPSVPSDSNSIIFPERWLKLRGNPTAESLVLINQIIIEKLDSHNLLKEDIVPKTIMVKF